MASGHENQEKINALPKEGVHCFAASGKQIVIRRIISLILLLALAGGAVYCFMNMGALLPAGCVACVFAIIALLVFIQTFLIAKYRVAIDYNEKQVVLRFRYSNIKIPFESFDARDGQPDRAEALVDNSMGGDKAQYLVLDDVFADACFQTSTRDLASREDFLKLREEAIAIADAYGARESEDKVRFWNESEKDTDVDDDDVEAIVAEAMTENEEEKAVEAKVEEVVTEDEDKAESEDKAEDKAKVEEPEEVVEEPEEEKAEEEAEAEDAADDTETAEESAAAEESESSED